MKEYMPLVESTKKVDDEFLHRTENNPEAKAAFIERIDTRRRPFRPRVLLVATLTVGFAASVIAVAYLGYFVGKQSSTDPIPSTEWLSASADEALTHRFDDGSRLILDPGARARVTESEDQKVMVLLERGRAKFYVTPGRTTDWRVSAGPYDVNVKGTVFTTTWNPEGAHFLLEVEEGLVRVEGPLAKEGHLIAANQSFTADGVLGKVELALLNEPTAAAMQYEAPVPPVSNTVDGEMAVATGSEKARPKSRSLPKEKDVDRMPAWEKKARAGQYKAAIQMVQSQGPSKILDESNPDQLFLLGDAARLTRRYGLAQRAYLRVRTSFGHTGYSTAAALALGRMAFDQQGNYKMASQWLRVYLNEGQGSNLDREILGRLMESEHKSGSLQKARHTASKYMERYPKGPHADLAKALLED